MARTFDLGPSGELLELKETTGTPVVPVRYGTWLGSLFEAAGGFWQRCITAESTQNILAFSAVYACVALISGDISKLRARLLELKGGIWSEVERNSPFWPVLRKPNHYQTWPQFIAYWLTCKLIYGNAYILLERDQRGVVSGFYPLDPRRVTLLVTGDGGVYYELNRDDLSGLTEPVRVPASEIIHDRMNALWHPLCGVSPIYACAASTTQGIRIQNNSEAFFRNMSRPSGQLTTPGNMPDETIAKIKRDFETAFSGDNLGKLMVLGSGLKYDPIPPIPAQDSQLIEQLKWTVEDVARAFGVPLYKISAGAYPNLTNVGSLNQDYYNHAIHPHLRPIEALIDEALGLGPKSMRVDIDENDMLRMDPLSRAEIADKKVKSGTLKPNEARAEDGLQPVAGGDECYLQQQNFSLRALAKRDAREDPFATSKPEAPALPKPAAPEPDDEEIDDDTKALADALIRKFTEAPVALEV